MRMGVMFIELQLYRLCIKNLCICLKDSFIIFIQSNSVNIRSKGNTQYLLMPVTCNTNGNKKNLENKLIIN